MIATHSSRQKNIFRLTAIYRLIINLNNMKKLLKFNSKLAKYLEKAKIKHNVLEHKTVYTAYDAAATMGKKLNEIAKSLLVLADKNYYLAILPADHNLDFKKLAKLIGQATNQKIKVVKIPAETVMQKLKAT